jgi:hypothetical protein
MRRFYLAVFKSEKLFDQRLKWTIDLDELVQKTYVIFEERFRQLYGPQITPLIREALPSNFLDDFIKNFQL